MWGGSGLRSVEVAGWPLRVPTVLLTHGPLLSLAVIIATSWNEPGQYSGTIEDATSWLTFLESVSEGVAIAAILMAWYAPRAACVVFAVLVQPWVIEPIDHPAYRLLYLIWPAIVLLDFVLRARQRAIATRIERFSSVHGPLEVLDLPWLRRALATALGAAVVAGMGLWVHERNELIALGERAEPGIGVVTAVDTAFDEVDMRVQRKTYEFFVDDASEYKVGSRHRVMVDPTGARRPYGTEDADPDGWSDLGVPVGGGLVLAGLVAFVPGRRRRRLQDLATHETVWVGALAREHPVHSGMEIFAIDDTSGARPLVFLPALAPCFLLDPVPRRSLRSRLAQWIRDLRDWANSKSDELWDEPMDEDVETEDDEIDLPEPGTLEEVEIAGLHADGALCLVRFRDSEEVLANVWPARDRWTVRYLALRLVETVTPSRDSTGEFFAVPRLLRGTAHIGPALIGVLGFLACWWGYSDTGNLLINENGAFLIASSLTLGWLAGSWWEWEAPSIRRSRFGLRIPARLHDQLVPAAQLREVRRLNLSVLIELEDDTIEFVAPIDRSKRTRQEMLDTVERHATEALVTADSAPPWPPWLPRMLPSQATYVAVGVALMTVLPAFIRGSP